MSLQSGRPPKPPVYLPSEIIADVLSFLPVKSVIRFSSLNKTSNSLISEPSFIKLHLNRSSRNDDHIRVYKNRRSALSFQVFRIFENPPIAFHLPKQPYYQLEDVKRFRIVGSCNGLLCLFDTESEKWLRIWNPATRTVSEKIWCGDIDGDDLRFGHDVSTNTYKVLYFVYGQEHVRVLTLGDNVWRNIQNSPVKHYSSINLTHLSGTVNWLANLEHYSIDDCGDPEKFTIEQFVIISLDLGTETQTPTGFYQVPFAEPHLSVLKDCLCFSHYLEEAHFVIWQMKEFGVEESWTQFLKISYDTLLLDYHSSYFHLLLLCYSEKNDTVVFTNYLESQAINRRDNGVERMNRVEGIKRSMCLNGHKHVESLVWYC